MSPRASHFSSEVPRFFSRGVSGAKAKRVAQVAGLGLLLGAVLYGGPMAGTRVRTERSSRALVSTAQLLNSHTQLLQDAKKGLKPHNERMVSLTAGPLKEHFGLTTAEHERLSGFFVDKGVPVVPGFDALAGLGAYKGTLPERLNQALAEMVLGDLGGFRNLFLNYYFLN